MANDADFSRIMFQGLLEELIGSSHVYFQPPSSVKLVYPCIIYNLSDIAVNRADNKAYIQESLYEVTYIDKNPDNTIKDEIIKVFPKCRFNRHFTNDNLNHYVYLISYKNGGIINGTS